MAQKITLAQKQAFIKGKLSTSPAWALKGLLSIYDYQTETEQNYGATIEDNGVGFTGVDAEILSSFAQQYVKRNSLSPKQMQLLFKKMPKYWRQIMMISDPEKLEQLICNKNLQEA